MKAARMRGLAALRRVAMASACKKRLIATLFAALEAVLTMDGAPASRAARQPHFKSLVQQAVKRHDLL